MLHDMHPHHSHDRDDAAPRSQERRPDAHAGHLHDHHHDHAHGSAALLALALALTAGFMVIEFAGGLISGSLALLADAGHMLTDAAALGIAWAAVLIARRPADLRRTFGYQRLRVLATFVNGCALMFITAWICIEAVQRFLKPAPVDGVTVLWIGSAGLAVNLAVFALLRRGDSHDMNVAAATLHVLGDLLGSVAAIAAALIIMYTGWMPIDPLLSIFVCLLIVRSAWSLIRRSTHILMEGSPEGIDIAELRSTLECRVPDIRDVHHVHAWLGGPQEILLTMHASVGTEANHTQVLRQAKAVLAERYGITHATIQIEAEDCADEHPASCGGQP